MSVPDTPFQRIAYLNGSYSSVKAFDPFTTYQLYFPPQNANGNSQYVPLRIIQWYWKGYADDTTFGTWGWNAREAAWGYSGSDYPTHPIWNYRHSADLLEKPWKP